MAPSLRGMLVIAAVAAVTIPLTAVGAVATPSQTAPGARAGVYEAHWLRSMVQADIFEIAAARLALARSQNATLRQAAESLVADHTTALQQKRALARSLRVLLPERTAAVQTMLLNQLNRTTDVAQFDQLFARVQIAAHQEAILMSAEAARAGIDGRLRTYAKTTVPVLKQHLQSFRALAQELGLPEGGKAPSTT